MTQVQILLATQVLQVRVQMLSSQKKHVLSELGTKWDLFNNRANLTAAVFRTEKQNTRIQIDPTTTANAGKSKVDGFEISLNGKLPISGMFLQAIAI